MTKIMKSWRTGNAAFQLGGHLLRSSSLGQCSPAVDHSNPKVLVKASKKATEWQPHKNVYHMEWDLHLCCFKVQLNYATAPSSGHFTGGMALQVNIFLFL